LKGFILRIGKCPDSSWRNIYCGPPGCDEGGVGGCDGQGAIGDIDDLCNRQDRVRSKCSFRFYGIVEYREVGGTDKPPIRWISEVISEMVI
jgi:hypothetical protein